MNSYRDYTWDVVRGIGILMVVLGHCAPRPLVDFVYLFHMGLFFFVSGYFLKITDNGSFLENEKNTLSVNCVLFGFRLLFSHYSYWDYRISLSIITWQRHVILDWKE